MGRLRPDPGQLLAEVLQEVRHARERPSDRRRSLAQRAVRKIERHRVELRVDLGHAAGLSCAAVHAPAEKSKETPAFVPDSRRAWVRLALALLIGSIGSVGMWSVVVALPRVQAEFGAARGGASLPYTLDMLGFGAGGILLGRLSDRFGIAVPLITGAAALSIGYVLSGMAHSLWQFAILHGAFIGLGS